VKSRIISGDHFRRDDFFKRDEFPEHCRTYKAVDDPVPSAARWVLAEKIVYDGCMTGRSDPAISATMDM
jgi:hypothetical protein